MQTDGAPLLLLGVELPLFLLTMGHQVFEVALAHAIKSHGHKDTPEFRKQLRAFLKEEPQPE